MWNLFKSSNKSCAHNHEFIMGYSTEHTKVEFCQCLFKRETPIVKPTQITAEQFIEKFRRNYINYAALIEVAFGLGDEMFDAYGNLTAEDQRVIIEEAKKYAAHA